MCVKARTHIPSHIRYFWCQDTWDPITFIARVGGAFLVPWHSPSRIRNHGRVRTTIPALVTTFTSELLAGSAQWEPGVCLEAIPTPDSCHQLSYPGDSVCTSKSIPLTCPNMSQPL